MSETSLGLSWDGASLPPPSKTISNVIVDNIKSTDNTTPLPILALLTRLVQILNLHGLKEFSMLDFVSEGVPLGEGATYQVLQITAEPADAMRTQAPKKIDTFAMKIAKVNIPRSLKRVKMSDEEYQRLRVVLFEIELLSHPTIRKHPNIAALVGFLWDERILGYAPCLMMEAATFGNARQFISSRDLTEEERFSICRDVASGLDFLHSCAIVHGDVKLDNILVYSDPKSKTGFMSKVSDFERSPQSGNGVQYTGTRSYNAPEVQRSSRSLSPKDLWRCDVFSFGLLTLETFSGYTQYEQIPGGAKLGTEVQNGGGRDADEMVTIALELADKSQNLGPPAIDICKSVLRTTLPQSPTERLPDGWEAVHKLLNRDDAYRIQLPKGSVIEIQKQNLSYSGQQRGKAAFSLFLCYMLGEYAPLRSTRQALEYVTSAAEAGYAPAVICGKRIFEANQVPVREIFLAEVQDPSIRQVLEELDNSSHQGYFSTAVRLLWPAKLRSSAIELLEALVEGSLGQQDLKLWIQEQDRHLGRGRFQEFALLLHHAVATSNYEACEAIVELGCNINSQTSDGITPLHLAMRCAEVAIVKLLLRHGADASITAHNNVSPLHWAVALLEEEVADIVAMLIEGIEYDKRISSCKTLVVFEDLGLRLSGAPIHWAIGCRNLAAVKVLTDPGMFSNKNRGFLEAIMISAIGIGCSEIITYLLQLDYIREEVLQGDEYRLWRSLGVLGTPLSRWLMFGSSHDTFVGEAIDALSGFGIRLPLATSKTEPASANWRLLTRASIGSHVHVMKELIRRGADVNEREMGTTVLEWTLQTGGFCGRPDQHAQAVELLLAHGANTDPEPVLHKVCQEDVSLDVFKVVLRHKPSEINVHFEGTVPLIQLLESRIKTDLHVKVQALVQAGSQLNTDGACSRNKRNRGGWMCCQTALSHSLYAMEWGIANYLLNCGASVEYGVKSGHRKTVLHFLVYKAAQTDWDTSQGKTEMSMRIMGDLLAHPKAKEQGLIHKEDHKGMDALSHATSFGLAHVVRILLERRHGISRKSVDQALATIPNLLTPESKPSFVVHDSYKAPVLRGLGEFRRYRFSEYKQRLEAIRGLLESFDRA